MTDLTPDDLALGDPTDPAACPTARGTSTRWPCGWSRRRCSVTDLDDLARRLAAHPRWKWRAGMLGDDGWRCLGPDSVTDEIVFGAPSDEAAATSAGVRWSWPSHLREAAVRPDLTDPATAGVMLAMLAEADSSLIAEFDGHAWVIVHPEAEILMHTAPTLGEASARALLAVWGEE